MRGVQRTQPAAGAAVGAGTAAGSTVAAAAPQTVAVQIPAGVVAGQKLRLDLSNGGAVRDLKSPMRCASC